jgi:AcrR family transcriptional regulator
VVTHAASRREPREQTEIRLLEAAEQVFSRRGYRAASLVDIAREAGYTTGAVYSNFSGKEDLFLAVAARQAASRTVDVATVQERLDGEAKLEDALGAWFSAFIETNPDWAMLLYEFWSTAIRDRKLRRRFRDIRGVAREPIAKAIREAEREGRLRRGFTSERLAGLLLATISGIAFEHAADPEAVPVESAGFAVAAIVRAAVKPRREAGGPD